jgi:hypothetical protein
VGVEVIAQAETEHPPGPPLMRALTRPVKPNEEENEDMGETHAPDKVVHWAALRLFYGDRDAQLPPRETLAALHEYRRTGGIDGVFFAAIGAAHEVADDASTWGPQSPAHVDWSGFPTVRKAGQREESETVADELRTRHLRPREDVKIPLYLRVSQEQADYIRRLVGELKATQNDVLRGIITLAMERDERAEQ